MNGIIDSLLPLAVPIGKVKVDPRNARKHPERNLAAIKASLEHYGQRKPIVVNKTSGFIEAGNGLWQAAKALGWDKIAVAYVTDASEVAQAYGIMDNQSALLAEWDLNILKDILSELDDGETDMDLTGFTADEIEALMTQTFQPKSGLIDDDEIPEKVETVCKTGDLWQLGEHRLLCGDSTKKDDVERLMAGEKADMVFTDPPYGLGDKKSFNNDHQDYKDEVAFDLTTLEFNSEFVIWGGNYYNELPLARNKIGWIVWDKRPTQDSWDEQTREAADRIFGQHFEIAITDISELRGKMLRKRWGGFYGTAGHPEDKLVHKTQKPIELSTLCFQPRHKIILDYFGGSGSTLIACEKLGRKCYGMEIAPSYCDIIIERWQQFTGKKVVKLA